MNSTSTAKDAPRAKEAAKSPLNEEMETLDGKKVNLAEKYKGKVVLLVNVASKCGYTKQYKPLEALHEKYAKKGLAIVGVPCNQFGNQEPGTAKEIAEFCEKNYGVKFDMLAKVDVNGDDAAPLYKYLRRRKPTPSSPARSNGTSRSSSSTATARWSPASSRRSSRIRRKSLRQSKKNWRRSNASLDRQLAKSSTAATESRDVMLTHSRGICVNLYGDSDSWHWQLDAMDKTFDCVVVGSCVVDVLARPVPLTHADRRRPADRKRSAAC